MSTQVEQDTEETVVIFRTWKKSPHSVIAVFPEEPSDVYGFHCMSYERVGQHGGCSWSVILERTRPALPEEYERLHEELEKIGYKLKIRKRYTYKMYQALKDKLAAILDDCDDEDDDYAS